MSRAARAARYEAIRQYFIFESTNHELRNAELKLSHQLDVGLPIIPWTQFVLEQGGTQEEALSISFAQFVYWSVAEQNIGTLRDLSSGERSQFESALKLIYGGSLPVRAKWYETNKYRLNPEAVRYVDNLLAQPS